LGTLRPSGTILDAASIARPRLWPPSAKRNPSQANSRNLRRVSRGAPPAASLHGVQALGGVNTPPRGDWQSRHTAHSVLALPPQSTSGRRAQKEALHRRGRNLRRANAGARPNVVGYHLGREPPVNTTFWGGCKPRGPESSAPPAGSNSEASPGTTRRLALAQSFRGLAFEQDARSLATIDFRNATRRGWCE